MGDVAMTVPVLSQMLEQHPEIRVTVLSRKQFEPLFKGLPRTQFLEADVKGKHKGLRGLIRLAKTANALGIDMVADLHNVLRSKVLPVPYSPPDNSYQPHVWFFFSLHRRVARMGRAPGYWYW